MINDSCIISNWAQLPVAAFKTASGWLAKSVSLLLVLSVISLVMGCGGEPGVTPTSEPAIPTLTPTKIPSPIPSTADLIHELEVLDLDTREPVEGATIAFTEVAPASSIDDVTTDENGQATIVIDSSDADKVGRLLVQAEGYKDEERYIDLTRESLPPIIYLIKREPVAVTVTSEVSSGETSPPSPEPTDMSVPASVPTNVPITPVTPPPPPPPPVQLSIRDIWPTGTGCQQGEAWYADIWVQPEGGDGSYTYYVDGTWKAGPTTEGMTIRVDSITCSAIVGTMTVNSAGQIASGEFYVTVPDCCN